MRDQTTLLCFATKENDVRSHNKKISSSCSSSLTHVENGGKNSRMKNSGPHKKYSEIITHLLKRGKMD